MLIIKEPIKLKCRENIKTVNQSFYHKIMDHYHLMNANFKEGEFLHLVTSPPEVYLATQEMQSVINQTSIYDNKELKIEMINNLLNRMSMSEQVSITYQDKIYIDNMLRKLGIKNTSYFIQQINQQKTVNQNLENKIERYWNLLTNINKEYDYEEEITSLIEKKNEEQKTEYQNYLHQWIMNRLNTGVIYRIMENFNNTSNYDQRSINRNQLILSEQKKISHQIFLNQLENYFSEEEIPFVYLENNSYERVENIEKSHREENINRQLTQAVLYRLLNSIHMERITNHRKEEQSWINMKESLYETAENTLFRMENQVVNYFNDSRKSEFFTANNYEKTSVTSNNSFIQETRIHPEAISEKRREEEASLQQEKEIEEVNRIYQQLEEINKKNLENLEIYQSFLKDNKETVQRNIKTVEERREESLRALHAPQELLMEYRQEASRQQEEEQKEKNQRHRLLPEETRKIYEVIEQYQKNGGGEFSAQIVKNDLEGLVRDTHIIHTHQKQREEDKEELIIKEREENNKVLEKWKQEKQVTATPVETVKKEAGVSLVHKQMQQTLEEEVLQRLLEENRTILEKQSNQEVVHQEKIKVTTIQQEEKNYIVQNNKKEITEMIDQGVRRQIGSISEQVYNRLEKKLSNEKKRRGF